MKELKFTINPSFLLLVFSFLQFNLSEDEEDVCYEPMPGRICMNRTDQPAALNLLVESIRRVNIREKCTNKMGFTSDDKANALVMLEAVEAAYHLLEQAIRIQLTPLSICKNTKLHSRRRTTVK